MGFNIISIFICCNSDVAEFYQPFDEQGVSCGDVWQSGDAIGKPDCVEHTPDEGEADAFDSKNPLLPNHQWVGGLARLN